MHIEPGLVDTTKIFLSYATGATALLYAGKLALDMVKKEGPVALLARSVFTIALVFAFFELLPHHPVGVSEVHLILGTTLLLLFGAAPAAIGLAGGLLIQSVFFAQQDLPQYGMNVTTLLVPLFATAAIAKRIVPESMAYVDMTYAQTFKLSVAYQGDRDVGGFLGDLRCGCWLCESGEHCDVRGCLHDGGVAGAFGGSGRVGGCQGVASAGRFFFR